MREIKKAQPMHIPAQTDTNTEHDVAQTSIRPDTSNMAKEKQANDYGDKITVRISSLLLESLKNIIASNKAGGNFEYTNVSDLMRSALEAYQKGMTLIAQRTKDQKRETSFRATRELKDYYQSLPDNAKSEIMERAIGTYIKHQMNSAV